MSNESASQIRSSNSGETLKVEKVEVQKVDKVEKVEVQKIEKVEKIEKIELPKIEKVERIEVPRSSERISADDRGGSGKGRNK